MHRWSPAATLVVIAPLIAEVLSGSTLVTDIPGLVFFIPLYGAGALLVRECVRRRGRGWGSVLILGIAFGIVEEGLAVQALFNPDVISSAAWGARAGGHVAGFYGVFTEAVLVYHAVWSITIPIVLTELLFPARADRPFLSRKGLAVTAAAYAVGVVLVGMIAHGVMLAESRENYWAPAGTRAFTAFLVVALGFAALVPRGSGTARTRPGATTPPAWMPLLTGAGGGLAFLALMDLPVRYAKTLTKGTNALVPMLGGATIVLLLGWLVRRWQAAEDWGDGHRLALVGGALLVVPVIPVLQRVGSAGDRIGLAVLEAALLALLVRFAVTIRARGGAAPADPGAREREGPALSGDRASGYRRS